MSPSLVPQTPQEVTNSNQVKLITTPQDPEMWPQNKKQN